MTEVQVRRRRLARALLSAAAVCFLTSTASGHGGIPRAFGIAIEPDNPAQMLLRLDVWGVMRTTNGGQSWLWSCAETYGANSLNPDHRSMLLGAGGRIVVASKSQGIQISDDLCNWRQAAAFAAQYVDDIVAAPWLGTGADGGEVSGDGGVSQAAGRFLALTATGHGDAGIMGELLSSTDNGENWTAMGAQLPTDFNGTSVRVSPSNPKRIYVAGGIVDDPSEGALERSDDGGETWQQFLVPLDPTRPLSTLRIAFVHPTRPDVLVLWVDVPEFGSPGPDAMLATANGGQTWTTIYESTGDLPGQALSPDGKTVILGGQFEGVQSADLDDTITRGQSAFTQIFPIGVWGLNWVDDGTPNGKLYAGNDNFTPRGIPAYMLGVSKDSGHTFEPLMTTCQIAYPDCSPSSSVGQACGALWFTPDVPISLSGFKGEFVENVRCSGADGGVSDAGSGAPTNSKSGCSCSVPGRTRATTPGALAAALLGLGLVTRRARRRRGAIA